MSEITEQKRKITIDDLLIKLILYPSNRTNYHAY